MKTLSKILFLTCLGLSQIALAQQSNNFKQLYDKIETAYTQGDYEAAVSLEGRINQMSQEQQDTMLVNAYYYLGNSFSFLGDNETALNYLNKSEKVNKAINGSEIQNAFLENNIGLINEIEGDFKQALLHYKEADKVLSAQSNSYYDSYINNMIAIGRTYNLSGQHKAAQKVLKQLKSQLNANSPYYADVLKELGSNYFRQGLFDLASKYYQEYYKKAKDLAGVNKEAEALALIARYKEEIGDYGNEELLLDQAKKKTQDTYLHEVLNNDLGNLYYKIGLYNEAKPILQSLSKGAPSQDIAVTLNTLALCYTELNDYKAAEGYFNKSLDMLEEINGKKSYEYAYVLKNKAYFLRKAGRYAEATLALLSAKNIADEIIDKSNPEYAKYLFQLGYTYYASGAMKDAGKWLNESLDIRKKYLGENHPLYAESTLALAQFNWAEDHAAKAIDLYHQTFNNYFTQINNYFPALSEQEKTNFYGNKLKPAFEAFNSLAVQHLSDHPELLGDMYNYQLATKGLIMYASEKVRKSILDSGDSTLIQQYNDWLSMKEEIAQLYSMNEEQRAKHPGQLDSLSDAANTLEKKLSRASSTFADNFVRKTTTWQDVRDKLKEGQAAVEIIRFRDFDPAKGGSFGDKVFYAALIVKPDTKDHPELALFDNGHILEHKYIHNYKNAILYKVPDRYSYDYFWKPIADKLKGVKTIFVSPDGVYNQINMNTLINPKTGKYLIDEKDFRRVTNTKDLLVDHSVDNKATRQGRVDLFGYPNYNMGLKDTEKQEILAKKVAENVSMDRGLRGNLQRYIDGNALLSLLPGTKKEVELIDDVYKKNNTNTAIYENDAAIEGTLKAVKSPKTLHIATHGFFLQDNEQEASGFEDKYVENPLLKSGLILAGANAYLREGLVGSGDDGILTAYEAMNMDLENTDLVVLSACETGLGDVKNGEGVYGLQRAFLIAGAKAIIMSLWSVDDRATQELMTDFYQEWLKTGDKQQAFHDAQLQIKKKYPEAFYWGAFVMVGK